MDKIMEMDLFEEWHKFLHETKEALESGKIQVNCKLSDYEIAINYVMGIAYNLNYKRVTSEMIYHLLTAFTDVTEDENNENPLGYNPYQE